MKILYGLMDGALLQRDENGMCCCTFGAECDGVLKTSMGELAAVGEKEYRLTGIPAGGAYTVELSDDTEVISLTLWVGDLWLLGGQSNMEGAGRFTEADLWDEEHPDPAIRAYFMDHRWGAAVPMLHESWLCKDRCHVEVWKGTLPGFVTKDLPKLGIGPGLFFAKKMYGFTNGVPQAVIPCALGGSSMGQWNPDGEDNLYTAMVARVKKTGGKVRGLFWYQGCSETNPDGIEHFHERMIRLAEAVRRDCGDEKLPFVQVQIAKNTLPFTNSMEAGWYWEGIREKQRTLDTVIPYMDTVAAIDGASSDLIHLSSPAQKAVGERAAMSMAYLCGFGGTPAPKLRSMELREDEYRPGCAVLAVKYDNADGLVTIGAPAGFAITETKEELLYMPEMRISHVRLEGNTVLLYTELTREALAKHYVRYGYLNMSHCTVGVDNGHFLPAFGPLLIEDCLE